MHIFRIGQLMHFGFREVENVFAGDERFRHRPEASAHRVRSRITVADKDAEQYACHVGVDNRGALAERKTADRAGGVGADPLKRQQRLFVGGQRTAVAGDRFPGDRVQPPRPDVVTERPPGLVHLAIARGSQRGQRRVLFKPLVILREHAIDLRLLQHHLGNQDVIRVGRLTPR
jgi:hypothetical protein